jgi:DNA-binding transcriptional MerR regulator
MSSPAFAHEKSPDAFRTISEVAAELDVPQHVLRFWESRFSQIKPVKRAGGRRYYRPEDVELLKGIQALLYTEGLTIRGVQKILKERGMRHVALIGKGKAGAPHAAPPKPEKKALAKKPSHLRPVPTPLSLPFFEEPARTAIAPSAPMLAAQERLKLKALLAELEGLKKKLVAARRSATKS